MDGVCISRHERENFIEDVSVARIRIPIFILEIGGPDGARAPSPVDPTMMPRAAYPPSIAKEKWASSHVLLACADVAVPITQPHLGLAIWKMECESMRLAHYHFATCA